VLLSPKHSKLRFRRPASPWLTVCAATILAAVLGSAFVRAQTRDQSNSNKSPQNVAQFETDLGRICAELQVPGAVAGIVSDGRIIWSHTYNAAEASNLESAAPINADALFPIASVSKTMAGVILMQLVDEGLLRLDEPITHYHPELQLSRAITLERILSHTSEDGPGEEFLYSSERFALLTGVIERVTGQPYSRVLENRIFRPLGMSETLAGRDAPGGEALRPRIAAPFALDPQTHESVPASAPGPAVTTATGVITTLGDLAKYAAAVDGDRLASARGKQAMFTATRSTRGETLPYGLGWFVEDYLGEHLVWHYGLVSGYSSLFVRVPSRGLTLIVLANSSAMSDEPRLMDGDLRRSPVALAFLADVVFAENASGQSAIPPSAVIAARRGGPPTDVPAKDKQARQLARDALVSRAWLAFYSRHADESARLLQTCSEQYPELGLPRETETPYLLVRLHRAELRAATTQIGHTLLEIHPSLAPVLYYDGLAEQQAGHDDLAQTLWKRACNQWPRTQHWSVGEACLEAGQSYIGHDARLARLYLDRAIVAGSDETPDTARKLLAKLPVAH
jgi:CubicO group peptidase (beta-lactamase class C family)